MQRRNVHLPAVRERNNFFTNNPVVKTLRVGNFAKILEVASVNGTKVHTAVKGYPINKRSKFLKEYHNFKLLGTHEHIVKFKSAFVVKRCGHLNGYYLQLELCAKGSLDGIYQDSEGRKYTEYDVQLIARQVTTALLYMKDNGVLHRDIKPGNILVRSYKPINVAVADMDLSKSIDKYGHATVCETTVGTHNYVAPEVLVKKVRRNGRFYNYKCDIWSLGIVIYELLAGGNKPFLVSESRKRVIENKFKKENAIRRETQKYKFRRADRYGVKFLPYEKWANVSLSSINLLKKMLIVRPYQGRASYEDVLKSEWLNLNLTNVPKLPSLYQVAL